MIPDVVAHNESQPVLEKCIENLHELHGSMPSDLQSPTLHDFNERFDSLPPSAGVDVSSHSNSMVNKDTRIVNNQTFEKILNDTRMESCYLYDNLPIDDDNELVTTGDVLCPHILEELLATSSEIDRPLNHSFSSTGSDHQFCGNDSLVITRRRTLKKKAQEQDEIDLQAANDEF